MAAVELKILLVRSDIIAFRVDLDFYYFRSLPIPQLFDADLTLQIIYNFDNWFQAKTHQRYSYRGFLDMAGAFADALNLTYSTDDINQLCGLAALAAKKFILTTKSSDYKKHYWVEMLNPVRLETVHADLVRSKFDEMRNKLGDDAFYNYLCRLWHLARAYRPTAAGIFERLICRLGRIPEEPRWPQTDALDKELVGAVLCLVCKSLNIYKNTPPDVCRKVEVLANVERSTGP
jgi:hypothetical protein